MSHNWGTTSTSNSEWRGKNGATQAWWSTHNVGLNRQLFIATYEGDPKYYIQTSDFSERTDIGIGMDTLEEAQAVYLLLE